MAFVKKNWKDRISQYPNRRTINDGFQTKIVTVGRSEGSVTEAGDSFNAANMNDLEGRIEEGINAVTPREVASATGNPCTFDTDLADNLVSLTAEIVASGGGGTPSTPIPINGYTEANITRCGVNLFGGEYNIAYKLHIPANTQFTISCNKLGVDVPRFEVLDASQTQLDYWAINSVNDDGRNFRTFTLAYDVYYVKVFYSNSDSIQLNFGADIPYHPYNGQTYAISFGQTVYGGVLDVTSGKLVVTYGGVSLTPSDTVAGQVHTANNGWAFTIASGQAIYKVTGVCNSNINTPTTYDHATVSGFCEALGAKKPVFFLADSDTGLDGTATVAQIESAFQAFITNYSPFAIYELITPFDIDLTPVQISALVGTNNITSDLGGDVEVDYYKTVNYKTELSELEDVQITSPSNGQILKFNGTKWVNANGGGGGTSELSGLSDVNISDVQDGETLVYDVTSEKWVNGQGGKHNYSTSEQVVGTWIDGETLYEKVVSITSGFSANMTVAHGISNLGEVVEFKGVLSTSNGAFENINDYTSVDTDYLVRVGDFDSTNFTITIGSLRLAQTSKINVIIRYTKSST